MPAIEDVIQFSPRELELLRRVRSGESTVSDESGPTPSSSAPVAGPDLQSAMVSPGAPNIGALPRGSGVAVGPGGYAMAGPVPQEAVAGLQSAGLPQIAAMEAPPPPDPQEQMLARIQQDVSDSGAAAARSDLGAQSQMVSLQRMKQAQEALAQAKQFVARREVNRLIQTGTDPAVAIAMHPELFQTSAGELQTPPAAMFNALKSPAPKPRQVHAFGGGGLAEYDPETGGTRVLIQPTEKPVPPSAGETTMQREVAKSDAEQIALLRNTLNELKMEKPVAGGIFKKARTQAEIDVDIARTQAALDELSKTYSAPAKTSTATPQSSKTLTKEQASAFLNQAGGDKAKARQLARAAGYTL